MTNRRHATIVVEPDADWDAEPIQVVGLYDRYERWDRNVELTADALCAMRIVAPDLVIFAAPRTHRSPISGRLQFAPKLQQIEDEIDGFDWTAADITDQFPTR